MQILVSYIWIGLKTMSNFNFENDILYVEFGQRGKITYEKLGLFSKYRNIMGSFHIKQKYWSFFQNIPFFFFLSEGLGRLEKDNGGFRPSK